jgi:hypothetical protein
MREFQAEKVLLIQLVCIVAREATNGNDIYIDLVFASGQHARIEKDTIDAGIIVIAIADKGLRQGGQAYHEAHYE